MQIKLSSKDQKIKEEMEAAFAGDELTFEGKFRKLYNLLPSDPRCAHCLAPFEGAGGTIVRMLQNKQRSALNPLMCNLCEEFMKKYNFGVEVNLSMLFADIRGSTPLAESMSPLEFKHLIDRFYTETTHVLTHSFGLIDKLVGDEVSAYYIPSITGKDYVRKAVNAAKDLLKVTGHLKPEGPWVPVGVGINTGRAYVGAVGNPQGMTDFTALGDDVNIASRLASQAAAGEVIISRGTAEGAELNTDGLEFRSLELKGKSEPMDVWVIKVQPE